MSERRWLYHHRLTVRFSDCDVLGHVNHAVYFTYFEECRMNWWRSIGGGASGMPGAGAIIVNASCNYRAPSHIGDELDVRLAVAAIGTSSVTLDYEIVNAASGVCVADGRTVNVAYDYTVGKTMPLPTETRERLTS
jgi:acyl-CoA thioester hydrolase